MDRDSSENCICMNMHEYADRALDGLGIELFNVRGGWKALSLLRFIETLPYFPSWHGNCLEWGKVVDQASDTRR